LLFYFLTEDPARTGDHRQNILFDQIHHQHVCGYFVDIRVILTENAQSYFFLDIRHVLGGKFTL
ncbi:MAG: hypothetical protein WCF65_10070, partial [Parachlamydiaceae bacterium]